MKTAMRKVGPAVLGILLVLASVGHARDHYSEKWKISVESESVTAGLITFALTFQEEADGTRRDSVKVTAPIPEDTSRNDIADLIAAAFKGTLGDDDFKIGTSWGEHVKVKTRGETPEFVIELDSNRVEGLAVEINED